MYVIILVIFVLFRTISHKNRNVSKRWSQDISFIQSNKNITQNSTNNLTPFNILRGTNIKTDGF